MKTIIAITEMICGVAEGSICGESTKKEESLARLVAIKVCLDKKYSGSVIMRTIGRDRTAQYYYQNVIDGLVYDRDFRDKVETVKNLIK